MPVIGFIWSLAVFLFAIALLIAPLLIWRWTKKTALRVERIERLLLDYATWKDPDFGQALRVRMKIPVQPWPGSDRRAQGAAAKPDQQQKSEDFEFLDDLTK